MFSRRIDRVFFVFALALGAILGLVSGLADWSDDTTLSTAIAGLMLLGLVYFVLEARKPRQR
jgi:uncharacterized membrane protein YfcA